MSCLNEIWPWSRQWCFWVVLLKSEGLRKWESVQTREQKSPLPSLVGLARCRIYSVTNALGSFWVSNIFRYRTSWTRLGTDPPPLPILFTSEFHRYSCHGWRVWVPNHLRYQIPIPNFLVRKRDAPERFHFRFIPLQLTECFNSLQVNNIESFSSYLSGLLCCVHGRLPAF